jgi:hypothetical protein
MQGDKPYRPIPPMQRYLTSRNFSMPYFEPSRPMPTSEILSHRRRPVPTADLGPGLRREDEKRNCTESSEWVKAPASVRRQVGCQSEFGSGDLPDIADGPLRILDRHARRKLANAALISSSLAASPASPWSIAVSSFGVASWEASASSASISSASSANSCCRSLRPGGNPFQYCPNLILGRDFLSDSGQRASTMPW